jgi:hypothetical protein
VTRDQSHLSRDPSNLSRDPSDLSRDPSNLSRDPSHLSRDLSHLSRDLSYLDPEVTAAFRRLPVETFTYSAFAPAPGCGEAVVVVGGETEVWQILGRFSISLYMGKSRVADPQSFHPDPDPIRIRIRIQSFNDQKLKKNYS